MENPVQTLRTILDQVTNTYIEQQRILSELLDMAKTGELTREECADAGFFCREISEVLADLEKEFRAKQEALAKWLCLQLVMEADSGPVRGRFCSASPRVTQSARLPKRGTESYYALLNWLGVEESVAKTLVLSFHYKGMQNLMSKRAEEGLPKPDGIEIVHSQYTCTFRRK